MSGLLRALINRFKGHVGKALGHSDTHPMPTAKDVKALPLGSDGSVQETVTIRLSGRQFIILDRPREGGLFTIGFWGSSLSVSEGDDISSSSAILHIDDDEVRVLRDLSVSGNKDFYIDHPVKSGHKLRHTALEGPEGGVYYRGDAVLENGEAAVRLPDYFEALTLKNWRTVQLTCADGWSPLYASDVQDGAFTVRTTEQGDQSQRFFWEVKAVRDYDSREPHDPDVYEPLEVTE